MSAQSQTAIAPLETLFRFPFEREGWKNKFLIGSVLIFVTFAIPLLPIFFLYGYGMRIMRQGMNGEDLSLPEWEDYGELFVDGAKAVGLAIIHILPGMFLFFAGYIVYFAIVVVGQVALFGGSVSESPEVMAGGVGAMILANIGGMVLMFVFLALGMFLMFAGLIPLPLATARMLEENEFKAGLRFRENWRMIRNNGFAYFVTWVVVFGATVILTYGSMLAYYTIILACIVPFLAAPIQFYLTTVSFGLFGQTYREMREREAKTKLVDNDLEPA